MKLSARVTYGMRALMALADSYGTGMLLAKQIAERQNLPVTYLEHLLGSLRRAGLVTATRGAAGGFRLARPPAEIDLAEAVAALEGPLVLLDCPGEKGCCGDPDTCALSEVFARAEQALVEVFAGVTLADLVTREEELKPAPMWFI